MISKFRTLHGYGGELLPVVLEDGELGLMADEPAADSQEEEAKVGSGKKVGFEFRGAR